MKIGAVLAFILAGLSTIAAVSNILGPNRPQRPENAVGYAVGSFLLPLLLLILGLWLLQKARGGRRREE